MFYLMTFGIYYVYLQFKNGREARSICISSSPSLIKSPKILANEIENMIGNPSVISPVASINITLKLTVILKIPARVEAAPIRAYFLGSKFVPGKSFSVNIPNKRPQKILDFIRKELK